MASQYYDVDRGQDEARGLYGTDAADPGRVGRDRRQMEVITLTSIMRSNRRFMDILRSVPKINPNVLAKELKDMEEHQLIKRIVHDEPSFSIDHIATDYLRSLKKVRMELHDWGADHRKKILGV